jgi:hypothetical protein
VNSKRYPHQPNAFIWDAPSGDGLLARVLNMHPYLFDTRLITPSLDLFNATLDWWLIPRAIVNWNNYYIVSDSDEFCVCGLLREERNIAADNRFDPLTVALYLTDIGCPIINRNNLAYGLKFHSEELDDSWRELERETQMLASDVLDPGRLLKPVIAAGRDSVHRDASRRSARGFRWPIRRGSG